VSGAAGGRAGATDHGGGMPEEGLDGVRVHGARTPSFVEPIVPRSSDRYGA